MWEQEFNQLINYNVYRALPMILRLLGPGTLLIYSAFQKCYWLPGEGRPHTKILMKMDTSRVVFA